MADVSWTINTSPDGDVTADALRGDEWPTLTRGTTQTVRFRWDPDTRGSYETIREYLDHANAVATFVGLDGTPYYRETHDDTEDLLMSFDPSGAGLPATVTGWWGVLTGGRDLSNSTNTLHVLELETFVLAELGEYGTRAAAEDVHER